LQPPFEHRGLFDFFLVGVAAPEVVGVDADDMEGFCVTMSDDDDCVGVVLLEGDDNCSVDDSSSLSSATVVEGSRGFPSSISWLSAGRFVEADRNSRTLEIVWTGRTFSFIVLPPLMVTWIAMLSAGSSLLETLEVAEPERERDMV